MLDAGLSLPVVLRINLACCSRFTAVSKSQKSAVALLAPLTLKSSAGIPGALTLSALLNKEILWRAAFAQQRPGYRAAVQFQ